MQHSSAAGRMPSRLRTHAGTAWLTVAAVLGALGSYAFQVLATRALGEQAFAPIGVLWTVQYLLFAVPLFAIETYLVRTVDASRGRLPRDFPVVGAAIAGVAVLTGGLAWWARTALFGGSDELAAVAALLALSYGGYAVARGVLGGQRRYGAYGTTSVLESAVRLLLLVVMLAVMTPPSARAVAWLLPVGAAVASLVVLRRQRTPLVEPPRAAVPSPQEPEADPAPLLPYLARTITTNGISQVLLAGGPLVLVALAADARAISIFFVTVTAARMPLVLAYGGLLSRLVPTLADLARGTSARRVGAVAVGSTIVLAIAAAGVGALLGPPAISLLFGTAFAPSAGLAAGCASGVTLACGALFLNQFLLASGDERLTVVPWLVGLACAAAAVVITPGMGPTARVVAGFVTGELVAVVLLWVAQHRSAAVRAA